MSATIAASSDLDERLLAQSALEAAEDALQSLCASQAGTFVQVERRGKALQEGLHNLLEHLEVVQASTTEANAWLQQDEHATGDDDAEPRPTLAVLAEQHRVRRRTLLQHSSLLELLELPSLMDACVRSNLYDEALSIAGLANTLEHRSLDPSTTSQESAGGSGSSGGHLVVQQVVQQIRQRQLDLRQQLWQRLSQASVTLPDCLEVVTALRRLNAIDLEGRAKGRLPTTTSSSSGGSTSHKDLEALHAAMEVQLQIDFLEARDVWLESSSSTSAGRTTTNPASHGEDLLDTVERYRTRVFEIATQFNAIFRANSGSATSSRRNALTPVALLRLWMSRRIQGFLQTLATALADVTETSTLRDALEAALFFATSVARLGADFTARLPALFEPVLVKLIAVAWKDGVKQLAETLVTCREAGVATPLMTGSLERTESDMGGAEDSAQGQPMRPPRLLLEYPPLARLVNAYLVGLNELRRCLLPGVVTTLETTLLESIVEIRQVLTANERAVHVAGLSGQAQQLRQASVTYRELLSQVVEPYLLGSLQAAVGNVVEAQKQYVILRTNLQPPEPELEEALISDDDEANVQDGTGSDGARDTAEAIPKDD